VTSEVSPLVTVTLTTDETAMVSAGLILLRRQWAAQTRQASVEGSEEIFNQAAAQVVRIEECRRRIDEMVTEEQGRELFRGLLSELTRVRHV
jgi:hypothetical protein